MSAMGGPTTTTGDVMDACDLCNYDLHRCPGCGEPLRHGVGDCGDCGRERA